MRITEVKVYLVKDNGRLKAYATVVFDGDFIIRDLKVIEGDKMRGEDEKSKMLGKYFVSMPSRRRKDGTFRDIVHPLNSDTRRMIEEAIINEYNRVVAQGGSYAHGHDEDYE